MVGALGIVRAGAAFVAIDPGYPDERLRWMLDDCDAAAAVIDLATDARLAASDDLALVVLEDGGELADPRATPSSERCPAPRSRPTSHTSSTRRVRLASRRASSSSTPAWPTWSTGTATAFALEARRSLHPDRQPRLRRLGLGDLAEPRLRCGIHVVPEDLRRDPVGLRDWLVAERITVTFLPTAVADVVIGLNWPDQADASLPAHRRRRADGAAGARPPLHRRQQLRAQRDRGRRHLRAGRARRRRRPVDRAPDRGSRGRGRRRGPPARAAGRERRADRSAASRSGPAISTVPSSRRSGSWSTSGGRRYRTRRSRPRAIGRRDRVPRASRRPAAASAASASSRARSPPP